jgi:site-specific recombinase XerD
VRLVDVYLAHLPASAPGNPRYDLATFCRWLGAAHPPPADRALRTLTAADVDAFVLDRLRPRRGRRRDPSTVYRQIAALGRFFAWAVARGALPSNPVPPEHRARGGP